MEKLEIQKRGQLTDRIKEKSLDLLGYEISLRELRLIPYIQYTLTNSQKINPDHINNEEKEILAEYVKRGFILDGVTTKGRPMLCEGVKLVVTKEFWDSMQEILWLGYVELN